MALIRIFDYLYYRMYNFYKIKFKETAPDAFATALLSTLQSFNIMTIAFIYEAISSYSIINGKVYVIVIISFFFIFNIFRYNKILSYSSLAEKWDNEEMVKRKERGWSIIPYIIVTWALMLILITILGNRNAGS